VDNIPALHEQVTAIAMPGVDAIQKHQNAARFRVPAASARKEPRSVAGCAIADDDCPIQPL
jgi:hypothetical protein